jgi:hypothetical protein
VAAWSASSLPPAVLLRAAQTSVNRHYRHPFFLQTQESVAVIGGGDCVVGVADDFSEGSGKTLKIVVDAAEE